MEPDASQTKLNNVVIIKNETKEIEMKIAAYIAIHSSIKSVDHLSELMSGSNSKGNTEIEKMKLHRTKCTMIIKNVISEGFKIELIKDIGDQQYSLIIDESTDVSVCKYLCLCIRYVLSVIVLVHQINIAIRICFSYFSKIKRKIITNFLGLVEITMATAEILADVIQEFLKNIGLNVKKMIGLGTDGANNLCGKHHSVYTILKQQCPSLQLVKFIAHSLHLCCSKAATVLPSSLDFLSKEVYNWFSKSTIRRAAYKKIFDLININENNAVHHKFVQLSDTRWLARANVLRVILEQWTEIKGYFSTIIAEEKNHMARILHEMFNDNNLLLYITVVYNVIIKVNVVSGLFQHENADIFKIYCELYQLLLKYLQVIIKPIFLQDLQEINDDNFAKISKILDNELSYISIELLDFGYEYRQTIQTVKLSALELHAIKLRCRDFILTLSREIVQRVPDNLIIFNSIKYFSPDFCLRKIKRPNFEQLPLHLLNKKVDKRMLDMQWNDIIHVEWNTNENTTSEHFWANLVSNHKNAGGEYVFRELADFALLALSFPLSNAVVERVFSLMNIMKTKIRNKINVPLLDSLLRIKTHFIVEGLCCKTFTPTQFMHHKFNANMYDQKLQISSDTAIMEIEEEDNVFEAFHASF